jgi:sugar phosphate isomerase/epimerase
MYKLSGFGDEISPDIDQQIKVLKEEKIEYLDLRGAFGKNILELSREEIETIRKKLEDNGIKVSCIASPIGKVSIEFDFKEHLSQFQKIMDLAHFFSTPYVRIFSYYPPPNTEPEKCRNEVIERIRKKTEIAKSENITLLLENEVGVYGDTPERCRDIIETINSPNLQILFDTANFVCSGIKPYTHAYPILKNYIRYLHIKDAILIPEGYIIVVAGKGEGEVYEVLSSLIKECNYDGFIAVEPHLLVTGRYSGFSGEELFRQAVAALKLILNSIQNS